MVNPYALFLDTVDVRIVSYKSHCLLSLGLQYKDSILDAHYRKIQYLFFIIYKFRIFSKILRQN